MNPAASAFALKPEALVFLRAVGELTVEIEDERRRLRSRVAEGHGARSRCD